MESERDAYFKAREKLQEALKDAQPSDTLELTVGAVRALMRGRAPDPDLPESAATFDARLVPFLRNVEYSSAYKGINVTPHPDGGAILSATDGHVLLMVRDKSATVSQGGCRVVMPPGALDACEPPKPYLLMDQGDSVEIDAPDTVVPDRVFCGGASLLVMPLAQPEGQPEYNGLALWASTIDTGNVIRDNDSRREDIWAWWRAVAGLPLNDTGETATMTLSAPVMQLGAAAAAALPAARFWHFRQFRASKGWATIGLPYWPGSHSDAAEARAELPEAVMIIMNCLDTDLPEPPDWVLNPPVPPETPEPPEETPAAAADPAP